MVTMMSDVMLLKPVPVIVMAVSKACVPGIGTQEEYNRNCVFVMIS